MSLCIIEGVETILEKFLVFGCSENMAIQAQLYQENLGFPLCGSQDWMMDIGNNGCGAFNFNQFSFGSQQKNHHHHHQDQQQIFIQELQNLQQKNDKFLQDSTPLSMAYSQRIAEQAEKQRQEVDQYIKLHVRNVIIYFILSTKTGLDSVLIILIIFFFWNFRMRV